VKVALALCLAALACTAAADGRTAAPACTGADLAARFSHVPYSEGAGQTSYALVVRNRSRSACAVWGLPAGRLLGTRHQPLPTRIQAAFPKTLTAVRVVLAPGQSARATARFSPDVPGVGEQHPGRCEPQARWLRVRARGGGSSLAKVAPQTSVCERGRLSFTAFRRS
jgi:hypothetical protein